MILKNKEAEMKALKTKVVEGLVDTQIIEVLNMIKSSADYYTSSS